ncbi:TonB-dependent siderophore receptor [Granulosicoccaceae sp. 1_MG-2023]|nr:TonB-dependent siderophore receptor [Granulosicoccaceae sp. 1_MG-2023]
MKNSKKMPTSFRASPLSVSVALGLTSSLAISGTALAQEEAELDTLSVEERTLDSNPYAEQGAPYKAKYSGDERLKKPLAEIPQNITVLTNTQIQDSGYTDLRDILDAQPGITLGTGENGNAFGDRYIIRGQEARSDVFVDGLRDPGMTTRESFAVEQVEITKGPNSSFAGRGTAGGAINSITKKASTEYDFAKLSTGIGSDRYTRVTLDANKVINDDLAVRANLLYGYQQVPDREPADNERQGLALSGLYQATDDLQVVLDYYGLRAYDTPDLGGYLTGEVPDREPVDNPPVYVQEEDFLDTEVDTFTARLNYEVNPDVRVTNTTRYGTTDNGYVATGARATTTTENDPNGVYDTASLSTHQGWQDVKYFANLTNLHWDVETGNLVHQFIFGLEYTDHNVRNGTYDVENNGATNCVTSGRGGESDSYCIYDSDGNEIAGLNSVMEREISRGDWDSDWKVRTWAVSAMDTVDLNDKWTLFGGLRFDQYDYELDTLRNGEFTSYDDSDGLINGHIGTTYKFRPDANVYFSYATATDINGGESDVGTSSGYGGFISDAGDTKPERTESFELGTKWNINNGRLLATAAVFHIEKSDVMEGDGYESVGTANSGANETQGIEFGLSGKLTDRLSAQAGVAFMDAEITESVNEDSIGKTLSNFADTTASATLKYQATRKLAIGGGIKYESKKYAGQPDTAAGYDAETGEYSQPVPAYTVGDLFAEYRFNKDLDMRLNIGNITNEDYYLAAYRSGSFLYKGDARNFHVTLNYHF